jgi:acyl-CoA reductase-like NAD-dependent aldehyde dehydrogenase
LRLQLSNRSVAVGNAVVLKPASDTPVTGGLLLAMLFEEARGNGPLVVLDDADLRYPVDAAVFGSFFTRTA